jgi:hypothetical protein
MHTFVHELNSSRNLKWKKKTPKFKFKKKKKKKKKKKHRCGFELLDWASTVLPIFAVQLLAARVLMGSGIVKLASRCPLWRSGRALEEHFLSQPMPHRGSRLAAAALRRLPAWVARGASHGAIALEIGAGLLALWCALGGLVGGSNGSGDGDSERLDAVAGLAVAATWAIMVPISLTGHLGFFPLLTALLVTVALLPSAGAGAGVHMAHHVDTCAVPGLASFAVVDLSPSWGNVATAALRVLIVAWCVWHTLAAVPVFCECLQSNAHFRQRVQSLRVWSFLMEIGIPLRRARLVGAYGPFARMTTGRRVVVLELRIAGKAVTSAADAAASAAAVTSAATSATSSAATSAATSASAADGAETALSEDRWVEAVPRHAARLVPTMCAPTPPAGATSDDPADERKPGDHNQSTGEVAVPAPRWLFPLHFPRIAWRFWFIQHGLAAGSPPRWLNDIVEALLLRNPDVWNAFDVGDESDRAREIARRGIVAVRGIVHDEQFATAPGSRGFWTRTPRTAVLFPEQRPSLKLRLLRGVRSAKP